MLGQDPGERDLAGRRAQRVGNNAELVDEREVLGKDLRREAREVAADVGGLEVVRGLVPAGILVGVYCTLSDWTRDAPPCDQACRQAVSDGQSGGLEDGDGGGVPRPRGEYATVLTPSSRAAATKPDVSISISNGLYSICAAMTFSPTPGTLLARRSTSTGHSLSPMYLTFPLST